MLPSGLIFFHHCQWTGGAVRGFLHLCLSWLWWMHEFVTVELLPAWPASVLEDKDQLALGERQCHLCTESIDSPGLDECLHSSAALGARGCILGKEFVTLITQQHQRQSCPVGVSCCSLRSSLKCLSAQPGGLWTHSLNWGSCLEGGSACRSFYWCNFADKAYFL